MNIEYPDVSCPECKTGFLIAETNKKNIVLKNKCSACSYTNKVKSDNILNKLQELFHR